MHFQMRKLTEKSTDLLKAAHSGHLHTLSLHGITPLEPCRVQRASLGSECVDVTYSGVGSFFIYLHS